MTQAECVNSLSGIRYRVLGRGPHHFDCWGLVLEVCRRMTWSVPIDPVEGAVDAGAISDIFGRHYQSGQWEPSGAVSGAVAFFGKPDKAVHAGIVIAGGVFDISKRRGIRHTPVKRIMGHAEFLTWRG